MPLTLSSLCYDVILLILTHLSSTRREFETPLQNLSLVSHHFRILLTPHLFKTLHINRPISQLTPTHLTQHATTFKIDMFGSMWWWCSGSYTSGSDALDLLRCIKGMERLRSLEVSMMKRSVDIWVAAFADESVTDDERCVFVLGKVETLVVSSSAAFLASHCPDLKSLVLQDGADECTLEQYTSLSTRLAPLHPRFEAGNPHLQRFDAAAVWSAEELENLVKTYPGLRCLQMRTDTYCYHASTSAIISILATGLTHLQTLHLVKSGSLGMGYQSVWKRKIAACSDAEYRRALWVENERIRVQTENAIAREAFGSIKTLRECWLGEKRVARRFGDDATQWVWERRREDEQECVMGGRAFAKMRMEKEAVVVGREVGW
jgi:hypothetical protein